MSYEMKFSINLYNLIRHATIIIDSQIYWFSPADNLGQSRRWEKQKVFFYQKKYKLSAEQNLKIQLSIIILVDRMRLQK